MEHPLVGIVITPPVLPRLKRRPIEVTTDQDFGLVSSPTKPERDISKVTLNNLNWNAKGF